MVNSLKKKQINNDTNLLKSCNLHKLYFQWVSVQKKRFNNYQQMIEHRWSYGKGNIFYCGFVPHVAKRDRGKDQGVDYKRPPGV